MGQDAPGRVVIENVSPLVDSGRFGVKAVAGQTLRIEADVFADGHDAVWADLLFFPAGRRVRRVPMTPLGHDRFRAEVPVGDVGPASFTIVAGIDAFATWADALGRRLAAGQDIGVELAAGARLAEAAAERASGTERGRLLDLAAGLTGADGPTLAAKAQSRAMVRRHPDETQVTRLSPPVRVVVERRRALAGAWYEVFPRSLGAPRRHGTLADLAAHLPHLAELGFDVVYLPPIHPIGRTGRKGKNNTLPAGPQDPGSPWAIGSAAGGHEAIHPHLGTFEDFDALLIRAAKLGLEIALDLAFQCSPDHPWVTAHPSWFAHRPDGSIRSAENPPKRYEDIYPLDFDSPDWPDLWRSLREVTLFWCRRGVRLFRVDNPHTKPFAFWEWLIDEVRREFPDTVFLAEAFTRPLVMYRLAKLGFSQSYTYFAWRQDAAAIRAYMEEISHPPVVWFFRPNLWPNTPDILTAELRQGGPASFTLRFLLAATLGAAYGIYGPAFERMEERGMENGTEEYFRSEKYEIRTFGKKGGGDLSPLIARVNAIRHAHPALETGEVTFHDTDNPVLLAYSKRSGNDVILSVMNTDTRYRQSGFTNLDLVALGVDPAAVFTVCDLLDGHRYRWQGPRNYVELAPGERTGHIFQIERE